MKKYNTLLRAQRCFTPLTIEGAESYQIGRIIFFNSTGIVASYNCGGIEKNSETITKIVFDDPIVIKRKIDFTIKSHFAVIDKLDYWIEKRYTLYLNTDLLENFVLCKNIKQYETQFKTEYFNAVKCLLNISVSDEIASNLNEVTFDCDYRSERTKEGERCQEYADICKKNNIFIREFEFMELFELFDIKLKKNK